MATIGLRLANVVLFVMGCSVAANVISDVGASVLVPERLATPPPTEFQSDPPRSWRDRQVILDRNLFDVQVVDEPIEPEPDRGEDAVATKLPYKLLGTIASEDQRVASAALENSSTRLHEVVKVGDTLSSHAHVEVEGIERGRILLRNGAVLEELLLDENVAARLAKQPPPKPNKRTSRRQARRARAAQPSVQDRLSQLADEGGARSPAAIFSQARILPKYEDGAMVGIELSKIKPDSFYEQVGLQEGDVITSVNGVSIDNPSASKELLGAFTSAEAITAVVKDPNGVEREISADPKLMESFGGSLR